MTIASTSCAQLATAEPELVRVSILGRRRQLDVALPGQLPIAALIPEVLAELRPAEPVAEQPHGWTLARIGGPPLPPEATLEAAGVLDGELLCVQAALPTAPGAIVDDVVDGLAEATAANPEWSARTARAVGYGLTLLGGLVAAVAGAMTGPSATVLAVAGSAALLLLAAGVAAGRLGAEAGSVSTLCLLATLAAATAGAVAPPADLPPAQVLSGGLCALTAALLAHRCTGTAHRLWAAVLTAGFLAVLAGGTALATGLDPAGTAAVTATAALATILISARLAVAAARLPLPPVPTAGTQEPLPPPETVTVDGLDAVPQHTDPVTAIAALALVYLDVLQVRAGLAAGYLTGIVVAAATAATLAVGIAATVGGSTAALAFGVAVSLALLSRARTHADRTESAVMIVAGALALLTTAAGAGSPAVLTAAAAALAVVAFTIGSTAAGHDFSPLQRRTGELAGHLVFVLVVPLLLWTLDVYRAVRGF